jgi:hypothetical protein
VLLRWSSKIENSDEEDMQKEACCKSERTAAELCKFDFFESDKKLTKIDRYTKI